MRVCLWLYMSMRVCVCACVMNDVHMTHAINEVVGSIPRKVGLFLYSNAGVFWLSQPSMMTPTNTFDSVRSLGGVLHTMLVDLGYTGKKTECYSRSTLTWATEESSYGISTMQVCGRTPVNSELPDLVLWNHSRVGCIVMHSANKWSLGYGSGSLQPLSLKIVFNIKYIDHMTSFAGIRASI